VKGVGYAVYQCNETTPEENKSGQIARLAIFDINNPKATAKWVDISAAGDSSNGLTIGGKFVSAPMLHRIDDDTLRIFFTSRFTSDPGPAFRVFYKDYTISSGALSGPARSDPVEQAADLAFVAGQLLDPATRPEPLRAVDFADHLAVIGHSDGGITAAGFAANSCCADPRVGAVVVLAGALGRFSGGWFTTASPPLLVMHGTADETNPVSSSQGVYAASPGPKRFVLVEGGSHIGAFEDDASRPAVVTLVADFLRASIAGDAAANARLDADSNVPGVLLPG